MAHKEPLSDRRGYQVAKEALAAIKPGSVLIDAGGYEPRTGSTYPSLIVFVRRGEWHTPFVTWELVLPYDDRRPYCVSGTYHAKVAEAAARFTERVERRPGRQAA